MPLYKLLRKSDHFTWSAVALDRIKVFLTSSPVLVALEQGKILLFYIATTTQMVSIALVIERESQVHVLKVHRQVYFVNEVLMKSKAWYPQIQKLLYDVLIAKQKLIHYFD
jgi:hypothetical protein